MKKTLSNIREQEYFLNKNINEFPPEVRPAWQAAQSQANYAIIDFKNQYGEELLKSSRIIGVKADKDAAAQITILSMFQGYLGANVSEVYERLSGELNEALEFTRREFGSNHLFFLLDKMYEIGAEIGIVEFYQPVLSSGIVLPTFLDVVEFVKKIVREAVGDNYNYVYIKHVLVKKALEKDVSEPNIILLYNGTESEYSELSRIFDKQVEVIEYSELNQIVDENLLKNEKLTVETETKTEIKQSKQTKKQPK